MTTLLSCSDFGGSIRNHLFLTVVAGAYLLSSSTTNAFSASSASSSLVNAGGNSNAAAFGPSTLTTDPTKTHVTPLEADRMIADVKITSGVDFMPTGENYGVSSVLASLSWYPRNSFSQDVLKFSLTPEASEPPTADELKTLTPQVGNDEDDEEYLYVRWKNPGNEAKFDVSSVIQTNNDFVQVCNKVPFPQAPHAIHPRTAKIYVNKVGKYADTCPELQQLARDIVATEDDLYRAVFQIAEWIHSNIDYSLESMGLEIQTASQVLASGWGKCDEMSALFVSLCRAVGIPARFVSGWAYTDNTELFDTCWGGHVWAEALVGEDWVPVDVTYGQIGYVDAGHVMLQTSPDVVESNVEYNARGNEFQCLPPEPLDCTVTPKEIHKEARTGGYHTSSSSAPLIDISMSAPVQSVQFGSALVILATVRNRQDYYVSTKLELGKTESTQVIHGLGQYKGQGPIKPSSDSSKLLLLEPHSIQMIPLVFRMLPAANQHVQNSYQFPFVLQSNCKGKPTAELLITVSGYAPFIHPEECIDANGRVILPGQQQQQQQHPWPDGFDDNEPQYGIPPPFAYPPAVAADIRPRFAHDVIHASQEPPMAAMPPPSLDEDIPPFDVGIDSPEATKYHPSVNPQPRYIVPPRRNTFYRPPNMNMMHTTQEEDMMMMQQHHEEGRYYYDRYFQVKPEHQGRFCNDDHHQQEAPHYHHMAPPRVMQQQQQQNDPFSPY
mmetsp:Transcript_9236/g.13487  ORF Transcript_9236/g.13487 Transcript_9236/m.13487 type:complete len:721 (-) Transcript_9236:211-2373(-)|eukprot:CAMPEP_0194208296 /NCGR_PEP_ID=MMETSP0156-20130528/6780_1 /TAXON_ID=33649 /ORGANISM="Thalassionema nitzschioides, Strain L26-B" /LENGTH=720 /DNA_ID=CAMNT_0038935229 /DNA_START=137 /DNA_END=2299 /DNA_ORIENTATION=+